MPHHLWLAGERLLPCAVILLIWTAVSLSVHFLRGVDMPTPWQTAKRLYSLLGGSTVAGSPLLLHLQASMLRWISGFSVAAFLGISFGLLAGSFPWFSRATRAIPQVLLMIPGLAWIPVALLLFGIGEKATLFMISVAAFAPMAINVRDGLRGVDPYLVRAARMMGTGRWSLFFQVLLPAALPAFLTGIRLSLGTAWRVLVAAEMVVGTGHGLGYAIMQSRWTLDYTAAFVCIALLCLIGLTLEAILLRIVEAKTIHRWNIAKERS
ncbi:ABC transporter permease [Desulfobulbus rhabdoformis]|uniref:ABC transporter permease n=1 Tax=Desulfobulbus rhabdoformis TaxID=34032 RepID=UPI001965E841|nr:ABC transporter permease [Desulfobulbus rhabdoformis]MBM9615886.1 ABC transporter permease [Desulfobulbus rhabdoformis]